jgi:hypothetical protein
MGFAEAYALRGGFQEWVEADYPLEKKEAEEENCITCHTQVTPGIVQDWKESAHAERINAVSCSVCHGSEHSSATDVDKAETVTTKRCRFCHENEWQSFRKGKHALAWESMQTFPDYHWRSESTPESMDGCADCHKVGFKSASEIERLSRELGISGANSCANCHTAHAFSMKEANNPEACKPCHAGAETPQWETFEQSRHGQLVSKNDQGMDKYFGPTCQTCHMQQGTHMVETAWGSLGLRLPWPEDGQWALARKDILTGMGAYKPQERLETFRQLGIVRVGQQAWADRRQIMLKTCSGCHDQSFAQSRLDMGDETVRKSDLLLAEGLNVVADLYQQELLPAGNDEYPFPDLLTVSADRHEIEKALDLMFRQHRNLALSAGFHAPGTSMAADALSALESSLEQIQDQAQKLKE